MRVFWARWTLSSPETSTGTRVWPPEMSIHVPAAGLRRFRLLAASAVACCRRFLQEFAESRAGRAAG
eukprot:363986-Chlamydomonas_euryale.AAC.5